MGASSAHAQQRSSNPEPKLSLPSADRFPAEVQNVPMEPKSSDLRMIFTLMAQGSASPSTLSCADVSEHIQIFVIQAMALIPLH